MPTISAFISDLDDTLLTEDHQMTARTAQTLQRVMRQGVKVVLASGRSAASMRPIVHLVNTPYPYIAYNGAQIVDAKTGEVLAANEIPVDLAREVLRWFEAKDVYAQYYYGDDWFFEKRCGFSDNYAHSTGVAGTEVGGKLSGHIQADTPKLLIVDDPAKIQELMMESRKLFGDKLAITTSKPYFLEITSPKATKGNALETLSKMIGLTPDTTICAGDSLNDISMLEWCARPVTVSGAREEVKTIAWKIAGDGHKDGIAILLDELIPEV